MEYFNSVDKMHVDNTSINKEKNKNLEDPLL